MRARGGFFVSIRVAVTALSICALSACGRETTSSAAATSASAATSSAAPSAAASASSVPARITGGHSADGGHHISVGYDMTNPQAVPSARALDDIIAKVSTCFRATPQYTANGAARVVLRVDIGAKGDVTSNVTLAYGVLKDQGHGAQAYEFGDASSPKSDALYTCALDAIQKATYPAGSNGTSFDARLTFSP